MRVLNSSCVQNTAELQATYQNVREVAAKKQRLGLDGLSYI